MPNLNRLTAAGQILRTRPHQKILILTIEEEEQVLGKCWYSHHSGPYWGVP